MNKMIELYEMVSLNDGALRGTEKLSILKAKLALNMFQRAMESFSAQVEKTYVAPEMWEEPDAQMYGVSAAAPMDERIAC